MAIFIQGMGWAATFPWRLDRILVMKARSDHAPIPVSLSGVRLAVYMTPQGPTQQVRCSVEADPSRINPGLPQIGNLVVVLGVSGESAQGVGGGAVPGEDLRGMAGIASARLDQSLPTLDQILIGDGSISRLVAPEHGHPAQNEGDDERRRQEPVYFRSWEPPSLMVSKDYYPSCRL